MGKEDAERAIPVDEGCLRKDTEIPEGKGMMFLSWAQKEDRHMVLVCMWDPRTSLCLRAGEHGTAAQESSGLAWALTQGMPDCDRPRALITDFYPIRTVIFLCERLFSCHLPSQIILSFLFHSLLPMIFSKPSWRFCALSCAYDKGLVPL